MAKKKIDVLAVLGPLWKQSKWGFSYECKASKDLILCESAGYTGNNHDTSGFGALGTYYCVFEGMCESKTCSTPQSSLKSLRKEIRRKAADTQKELNAMLKAIAVIDDTLDPPKQKATPKKKSKK